jgi:hypothetical protein
MKHTAPPGRASAETQRSRLAHTGPRPYATPALRYYGSVRELTLKNGTVVDGDPMNSMK